MLALIPILLLLIAAAAMALVFWLRPDFRYHWLVAVGGAFTAWVSAWVLRLRLPTTFSLSIWAEVALMPKSPKLLVDPVSWPFALALTTLCLAVILTDVGRATETSWVVWAGDLGVTALGVAAVLAGNPVTLVIAWVLIDVMELVVLFQQVSDSQIRRRVVVFFSTSIAGMMLVLWAMTAARGSGVPLSFELIPPAAVVFLLLAVGLRLGVLPLQVSFLEGGQQRRGQGTLIRLIPPATSLVLLVRTAYVGVPEPWRSILLGFAALAALYGGAAWLMAEDEMEGRIYWITGLAGLAFAGAIQGQPAAVLAWSLVMVYAGSTLFLASVREKRMLPIGVLAVFGLTALPFSPTIFGAGAYVPFHIFTVFLMLAQIALMLGFVRHMIRVTDSLTGVERWVLLIYPLGLALLPLTQLLAGSFLNPDLVIPVRDPIWPGLVATGLGVVFAFLARRGVEIPENVLDILDRIFSLRWLFDAVWWLFDALGRVVGFVTTLLEGEGGVLWALLLVAVLISLIGQVGGLTGGL